PYSLTVLPGDFFTMDLKRKSAFTPALIGIPKVIHHRRGSLWKLAAADVNNFCGRRLLTCEQLCVALEKERHATGMTNTLAHVYHASGETFAPSHFPLTATNTQRLPFCRPSIRLSTGQIFA